MGKNASARGKTKIENGKERKWQFYRRTFERDLNGRREGAMTAGAVQRPWGRSMLGRLEGQHGSRCGWSRAGGWTEKVKAERDGGCRKGLGLVKRPSLATGYFPHLFFFGPCLCLGNYVGCWGKFRPQRARPCIWDCWGYVAGLLGRPWD